MEWHTFILEAMRSIYLLLPQGLLQDLWIRTAEFLPQVLLALFTVVPFIAGRFELKETLFRVLLTVFIFLTVLGCAIPAFFFFVVAPDCSPLAHYLIIGFIFCIPIALGAILGILLKHYPHMWLYFAGAAIMLGSIYFISVIVSGPQKTKLTKEELRAEFKAITGENPNEKQKKSFWESNTGNEEPSKADKDNYWNK